MDIQNTEIFITYFPQNFDIRADVSVRANHISPHIASPISFSYLNGSETAYNVIIFILIVIVEYMIMDITFVAVMKNKGNEIGCRNELVRLESK